MSSKIETSEIATPPWRATFIALCESLPEKVEVPYHLTAEGERLARFRKACPPEFMTAVDRGLLPNAKAFDTVALWDGSFPGPCAFGATATAKSRAAWSALGRLFVRENKRFKGWPVRSLVAELESYESKGIADEFFRNYSHWPILFVDDLDKVNWQFESQLAALFSFYDWVYRAHRPCITTTNKSRTWWSDKMGEAFARRLFDDAHLAVDFGMGQGCAKHAK